jgi:peptidoglycan/xylan/chitin deacetylase (PgdA/CDA1 family)
MKRRSPIDCAWVSPRTLRELLDLSKERVRWETVSELTSPGGVPAAALCFDDAHESVYSDALPVLAAAGVRATVFAVSGLIGRSTSGGDVYGAQQFMSPVQLREWVSRGHEVGSHTMSHAALPFLSQEQLVEELKGSKSALEDVIGAPVTSLSFPYGCWNARIWDTARSLGYLRATVARGAVTAGTGLFRVTPAQHFDAPRDLLCKLFASSPLVSARARVMEQFSRGPPLWRFRRTYTFHP